MSLAQVLVETAIVELSADTALNLGLEWRGAWAVALQMSERENTTSISGEITIRLGLPDGREQMYSVPCRDDTLAEASG
ncbi:MAG: hypothetical protein OXC05_04520 [Halieaceae bacterium]|nr:hypothetical protein [Halieaceae bacterium]